MNKNRKIKLIKGDIIYKNKYPLVRIKKVEQDFGKFTYMVFTKDASSSEPDNFEPMMNYHLKSIALDRAYDVVHNSIIELMKEVRQIKRDEKNK
tara:strand:+ start:178 stop:459 length:282 start_codon:yes stop_codon:yes gene_type:complete